MIRACSNAHRAFGAAGPSGPAADHVVARLSHRGPPSSHRPDRNADLRRLRLGLQDPIPFDGDHEAIATGLDRLGQHHIPHTP